MVVVTEEVDSRGYVQQVDIPILFAYVADLMIRILTWFRPTEAIQPARPRSRSRPRPADLAAFTASTPDGMVQGVNRHRKLSQRRHQGEARSRA